MESGSSSSQSVGVTAYPSNLCAASFISVKLRGRDNYPMWKTQMLCLFQSHDMDDVIYTKLLYNTAPQEGGDSLQLRRRSDAVVKGWILGSLTEETFAYVFHCLKENIHRTVNPDHIPNPEFDACDLWDELRILYDPPSLMGLNIDESPTARQSTNEVHERLHRATLEGDWEKVHRFLMIERVSVFEKITNNGNTVLHVAAASTTKKPKLLQKLLEMVPDTPLQDLKNEEGSTLLHVATIVGNTKTAEILLTRNRELWWARDNKDQTALAIALSNMDTKMSEVLLFFSDGNYQTQFSKSSYKGDDELLAMLISSNKFRLAHDLMTQYRTFYGDDVLMAIAQNFPNQLNIVEKYIGTNTVGRRVKQVLNSVRDDTAKKCVPFCGSWVATLFWLFFAGIYGIIMLFPLILKMLAWPLIKKRVGIHGDAMQLLEKVCTIIRDTRWTSSHHYYTNSIFEATIQNASEVVECIVRFFPHAILTKYDDGHNIIQYAVINRSEKVYNLLYQMSEHKNVYRTTKDTYRNNLLHLAGRLAPSNKLNLISGAFLQIQRELQWFKEVQGFVSPLNVKQKNIFNETPEMVFAREHTKLVSEGEKWLKATAESYTITAALITTVVFAAGITVPGGNKDSTGIPVFDNNPAFTVFAISDAISLISAVTSLLMFLSILTARYAEQDFLLNLPTKLIIGLVTLFISTTAMLVASGAMLYLVFGQKNSKILITIVVFTCLPIAAFVTLQSRLVIYLMSATYGRSIFGKKSNRLFH